MNLVVVIYLCGLCDNLAGLAAFILAFCIATLIVNVIVSLSETKYDANKQEDVPFVPIYKTPILIGLLSLILVTVIPSTNMAYIMVGAAYLNNNQVPQKVMQIINAKLDTVLQNEQGTKK